MSVASRLGLAPPPTPRRSARGGSPHRAAPRALVAAAERVTARNGQDGEKARLRRLTKPWQAQALTYYERAPEARFAANFHANAMSHVRLYPAKANGTEIEEVDDDDLIAILDRIHDPGAPGRSGIQAAFGSLMFQTGEGYLLCTGTGNTDEPERWEFVSTDELRVDEGGRLRRFNAPGGHGVLLSSPGADGAADDEFGELPDLKDSEAVAYRFWRPSPRYSQMPDSPMLSVLELFEELILLQMAVRARVRSRLAASGVWAIADNITVDPPDAKAAAENPKVDWLLRQIIEHTTRPIQDEGTASAVVPYLLRVPLNENEKIQDLMYHFKFHDPNETYREAGLRDECRKRIAAGIDLPAEILLGLADSNHWTAWQIDEQTAKASIFPVCSLLCSNVTSAYFRPAAREADRADWEELFVWYDPADIVVHPDKSGNARELWDRGDLTDEELRDAHGYSGAVGKSEEEDRRWFAIVNKDWAVLHPEEAPEPPQLLGPDGQPIEQAEPDVAERDKTGTDVVKKPPLQAVAASVNGERTSLILGAAESALDRARERAGARVRGRASSCDECMEGLEEVENEALVAALGTEKLDRLGAPPADALVAGTGVSLVRTLSRLGVEDEWARTIGDHVETHAARTLLDESPGLPAQFVSLVSRMAGA